MMSCEHSPWRALAGLATALCLAAGAPACSAAAPVAGDASSEAEAEAEAAATPKPRSEIGGKPVVSRAQVIAEHPHDPGAFTQGLFFSQGRLFETTGQYGQSQIREVDLKTGKVLRARNLADTVFGEGAVAVGDVIVSLTWRRGVGLVHDIADFKPIRSFPIEGEGWGLTYDGENLIMSDGTAQLRYLDPETFKVTKTLAVTVEDRPVDRLNELEWVEGEIYANVWQTDWIVRIDPQSGAVIGLIDVSTLFPTEKRNEPYNDVPNGVAWDATSGKLYVTGKNWPKMFEIANP